MVLLDTSNYCTDELVENLLVEVLPVNKSSWVTFLVAKNFNLILNSSNLKYNKVSSTSELIALPDGIYEMKMSFKPNILNVSQFYHLRIVDLQRKLQSEFNKLLDEKCDISKFDYNINKLKLRDIEEYMLAAKWQVEECLDKKRGKELYEFALKLLQQYTHECKC